MADDIDFFRLTPNDGGAFRFTVEGRLARLDGKLYGGTAIGASIVAAETLSQRQALWMTTQFVSTAPNGTEVHVTTEILAAGRRTNQVRVTGSDASGAVLFASLGATGTPKPTGLTIELEHPPTVTSPDESERWTSPFSGMAKIIARNIETPPLPADLGFATAIEIRQPEVRLHPDAGPGRLCLWIRRRDGVAITPAVAAYMADMVPLSIAHAAEVVAGGTSLDNTIRIGSFVPTEWILLDLRPHLAAGDYGHGAAHIWSEDGHLMATASQTASMMHFDVSMFTKRG